MRARAWVCVDSASRGRRGRQRGTAPGLGLSRAERMPLPALTIATQLRLRADDKAAGAHRTLSHRLKDPTAPVDSAPVNARGHVAQGFRRSPRFRWAVPFNGFVQRATQSSTCGRAPSRDSRRRVALPFGVRRRASIRSVDNRSSPPRPPAT